MSASADVIVLSSSPDRTPTRSPVLPVHDPERLFDLSPRSLPPSPVRSPSELFQVPTRSRFFGLGSRSDEPSRNTKSKASEEATVKFTRTARLREPSVEDKPKRRRKEPTSESQTTSGGLGYATHAHKDNASKQTTTSRKKRSDHKSKRVKPGDKTITGKVAKVGNVQPKLLDDKVIDMSTSENSLQQVSTKEGVDWDDDGLLLDAAMKRRMDWTPTKDTTTPTVELSGEEVAQGDPKSFGSFLSEYGFNDRSSAPSNARSSEDDGPTKRRRIELVDPRLYTSSKLVSEDIVDKSSTEDDQRKQSESKKKSERQPKKLTTLTARVTARYLNDFTGGSDSSSRETTSRESSAAARTKNTKGKAKGKSKLQEPEFLVLSPEAAAKSLEDQDLIFGTCSQLEREDSPTTLREMQAAITESERCAAAEHSFRNSTLSATTSRFSASRSLWSIGARDFEGSLIRQAEVVDLVDTPKLAKVTALANDHCSGKRLEDTVATVNIRPLGLPRSEAEKPKESLAVRKASSPASNIITATSSHQLEDTTSQSSEPQPTMPHYTGFTEAELSKQVATYGFKPLKNRKKMIEILQKCWESKHGSSTKADTYGVQQNAPFEPTPETASSQSKAPEKLPRKITTSRKTTARSTTKRETSAPPKSKSKQNPSTSDSGKTPSTQVETKQAPSTRSFINVEEIEDSEEEAVPSPSRVQSQYISEKRQPLTVSKTPFSTSNPRTNKLTSNTTTTPNHPDLADKITKAMLTQPAGTPSRPSWYEKILMYDPIILEDFATWLNTEGLGLVDEDREVGTGFLRKWCESRGICCCYRKPS